MASILSSQGMVFIGAMAVSGAVILLTFRRQKYFHLDQIQGPPRQVLRSCISSEGKKREKKKKKVQFAEDLTDTRSDGEELRLQVKNPAGIFGHDSSSTEALNKEGGKNGGEMPANRAALYNAILRDRGVQRLPYSYSQN